MEVNSLTGTIPSPIWNISSLVGFSVRDNKLTGTIPPNAFNDLPLLELLFMGNNKFHGELPSSLTNATSLVQFEHFFFDTTPPDTSMVQIKRYPFVRISE